MISKDDLFIIEGGENVIDGIVDLLNEGMEEIKDYVKQNGV